MREISYLEAAAHQSAKLRLIFRRLKSEISMEKEIVFQNCYFTQGGLNIIFVNFAVKKRDINIDCFFKQWNLQPDIKQETIFR